MRRKVGTVLALMIAASACSSDPADPNDGAETTSATAPGPTITAAPPVAAPQTIVLNGQGNDLAAYLAEPPYTKQIVIPHFDEESHPDGLDINAQICFDPENPRRFVAGEDTHQPDPPQGWGIFELHGDRIGELSATQVGKLTPTYQGSLDNAENYGCGFLPDGRIVTTDVGNQASGPADGQLIVWYPPFDSNEVDYCKLDIALGTGQQIAVTDESVFVAQARGPGSGKGPGVYEYSIADIPKSIDECDDTDATEAPMHAVDSRLLLAPGDQDGLGVINGIAAASNGNWYLSGVIGGAIAEFTADGEYVRNILTKPDGEDLEGESYSTGTPLGIGVGPDGSVYYADIGIVIGDGGIGPGRRTGKVRRIAFDVDGQPMTPEVMDEGLSFPDGIGIITLAPEAGGEPFTEVRHVRRRFVDTTRPTGAAGDLAPSDERVLLTDLYLPTGPGPFPLIVHAHGLSGGPEKFTQLLSAWADAGFVVAAPRFPRTSDWIESSAGVADYANQPADVSFVLDQLLDDADLAAMIDSAHVGISGLSLGGGTVYGLVYNECCRDERFDAAIVMSSLRFPFGGDYATNEIPVMILHGDADPALPYDDAVTSYDDSAEPKWFVHLIEGGHAEPYENTPSPHDDVVIDVTVEFWRGTIGGDEPALDHIAFDGNVKGVAEVLSSPT
jgi:dienelactone hydrolase